MTIKINVYLASLGNKFCAYCIDELVASLDYFSLINRLPYDLTILASTHCRIMWDDLITCAVAYLTIFARVFTASYHSNIQNCCTDLLWLCMETQSKNTDAYKLQGDTVTRSTDEVVYSFSIIYDSSIEIVPLRSYEENGSDNITWVHRVMVNLRVTREYHIFQSNFIIATCIELPHQLLFKLWPWLYYCNAWFDRNYRNNKSCLYGPTEALVTPSWYNA